MTIRRSTLAIIALYIAGLFAPCEAGSRNVHHAKAESVRPPTSVSAPTAASEPADLGSPANPLFVRELAPPDAKGDKAAADLQHAEDLGVNRRLMWFTGCLAAFALFQLLLFWWQLSLMRRDIRERGDKERPMVFLHTMELRHANGMDAAGLPPCGRPVVSFANYGSTPAIVVRILLQHCFDKVLGEPPRYTLGAELADGTVIEPGKKLEDLDLNHRIELPEGRRAAIEAGETKLWIYGRIDVRDYMGRVHEHRFCRRWAHGALGSGMVEDGPDSYHSNRERDRAGRVASLSRRLAAVISGSAS